MGLAILAFVIMTATVLGGWAAVNVLPGKIASRRLDRRLRDVGGMSFGADTEAPEEIVRRRPEGPLPSLDRMVAGWWLPRLIEQAGTRTTASGIVVISFGLAIACALVASVTASRIFIPIAAFTGLVLPTSWLLRVRLVRRRKFEAQFPDALDLLARAIRAGHALQTAMGMVADELPAPVGPEFKKAFEQQNYGLPLRDALNELSERVGILDVRFFVTAVLIQRETGGNLAEVLDNLAEVVRERFKILRQVRVHTAHGRFTGYVLLALPAALGVALMMINPELMQLLFNERMGQMLLTGAMVLQTVGFFWIRHVIKIEV